MQRHRSIDADLALHARRRLQTALGPRPPRPGPTATDAEETEPADDLDELGPVPRRVGSRRRRFDRTHLAAVAVLALVGLALTAVLVLRARPVTMAAPTSIATVSSPSSSTTPATSVGAASSSPGQSVAPTAPELVVHVVGEVRRPGVVEIPGGSRVADALAAAGGLTGRAEPGELNLAQPLADGQQVVVVSRSAAERDPPEVSEVRQPGAVDGAAGAASSGATTGAGAPVDLNLATEAELDELPGVGPVTAAAILAWRQQHGRFSEVTELQEVDGIGPKTYADLAPLVGV